MTLESRIVSFKKFLLENLALRIAENEIDNSIRDMAKNALQLMQRYQGEHDPNLRKRITNRVFEMIKKYLPDDYMKQGYEMAEEIGSRPVTMSPGYSR